MLRLPVIYGDRSVSNITLEAPPIPANMKTRLTASKSGGGEAETYICYNIWIVL